MAFAAADLTATSTPATFTFNANETIIIGLQIANASNTTNVKVDVKLRGKYLLKNGMIPYGDSLSVLDGKIVAGNTDVLEVVTDGEPVDVIISYTV